MIGGAAPEGAASCMGGVGLARPLACGIGLAGAERRAVFPCKMANTDGLTTSGAPKEARGEQATMSDQGLCAMHLARQSKRGRFSSSNRPLWPFYRRVLRDEQGRPPRRQHVTPDHPAGRRSSQPQRDPASGLTRDPTRPPPATQLRPSDPALPAAQPPSPAAARPPTAALPTAARPPPSRWPRTQKRPRSGGAWKALRGCVRTATPARSSPGR